MEFSLIHHNWKEYIFLRGFLCIFQSILGSGIFPGRKENDRARQTVFFLHTSESIRQTTQMKKNLMVITRFLRRYITKLIGNAIKMQYCG